MKTLLGSMEECLKEPRKEVWWKSINESLDKSMKISLEKSLKDSTEESMAEI